MPKYTFMTIHCDNKQLVQFMKLLIERRKRIPRFCFSNGRECGEKAEMAFPQRNKTNATPNGTEVNAHLDLEENRSRNTIKSHDVLCIRMAQNLRCANFPHNQLF